MCYYYHQFTVEETEAKIIERVTELVESIKAEQQKVKSTKKTRIDSRSSGTVPNGQTL